METVIEILIDFSGSMEDKMVLTKKMLVEVIIPKLNFSSKIGIKTFTTIDGQPLIKPILPLNITNREEIETAIRQMGKPKGGTPISAAIRDSINTLKNYPTYEKGIILVTDGEEDAGGNYVAEAERANREGIECAIHLIGIGLKPESLKKAVEIAKITNGSFNPIDFKKGETVLETATINTSLLGLFNSISAKTKRQDISPNASFSNIHEARQGGVPSHPTIDVTNSDALRTAEKAHVDGINNNDQQDSSRGEFGNVLNYLLEEIKEMKIQLSEIRSERHISEEENENDALITKVGAESEKHLFNILNKKYPERVRWLNETGESYADHDFEVLEPDGKIEYYIECKGTVSNNATFIMTKSEWRLFLNNTKNYQIYFIRNLSVAPSYICINNLLDWLLKGKVIPYSKQKRIVKEDRVFLTIDSSVFED
jgi:hypothetical protein